MASFSSVICYGRIKKYIFGTWMSQSIHRSDFRMVKFAKIAKMTVIIAFPQGVGGAKIKINRFFRNDTKSLKCGSLRVFGPSDGSLGSLEQKKARKAQFIGR